MNHRSNINDEVIRAEFNAAWPRLLSEIMADPDYEEIRDSLTWMEEVLQRNVPLGKQNRALIGVHIFRHLKTDRTPEDDYSSYVLGWVAEIMQACALVADDIMDGSETRRGLPCWYTVDDVGMNAINDAFMLENIAYYILNKYFGDKEHYLKLLRHIQKTSLQTIFGQSLDSRLCLTRDLNQYTQKKYEIIVKYKTTYYSFYSPVACAMLCAGVEDPKLFELVEELVVAMGYLFQVQDDYLDCYGDPSVTGKIGSDIMDGKCNWLIVKALELASDSQYQELDKYYGSKNELDQEEVKKIFNELNLKKIYRKHEDDTYHRIVDLIAALPSEIPPDPLLSLLNSIYKREK